MRRCHPCPACQPRSREVLEPHLRVHSAAGAATGAAVTAMGRLCPMSPRQLTVPSLLSQAGAGPAPRPGAFGCSLNLVPCRDLGAQEGAAGTRGTGPGSVGFICAGSVWATVPPAPSLPQLWGNTEKGHWGGGRGLLHSAEPGTGGSPAPLESAGQELPRPAAAAQVVAVGPGIRCSPLQPGLSPFLAPL